MRPISVVSLVDATGLQCTCTNTGHSSISHGLSVNVTHSTHITCVCFWSQGCVLFTHDSFLLDRNCIHWA